MLNKKQVIIGCATLVAAAGVYAGTEKRTATDIYADDGTGACIQISNVVLSSVLTVSTTLGTVQAAIRTSGGLHQRALFNTNNCTTGQKLYFQ